MQRVIWSPNAKLDLAPEYEVEREVALPRRLDSCSRGMEDNTAASDGAKTKPMEGRVQGNRLGRIVIARVAACRAHCDWVIRAII